MEKAPHFGMTPWLKGGSLADHIGRLNRDMIRNPCWTVSTLIQGNSWRLTIPSLTNVWSLIPRTDIHAQDVDYWLWTAASKGIFTFKSAWILTRQTSTELECHRVIWFPSHYPKWQSESFAKETAYLR